MPSTTIMILEWMTASQVLWLIILSGKNQCLRILLRIGITQSLEEVPKTRVVGRHFLWVRYNSLCWIVDITVTEKKNPCSGFIKRNGLRIHYGIRKLLLKLLHPPFHFPEVLNLGVKIPGTDIQRSEKKFSILLKKKKSREFFSLQQIVTV